MSWEDFRSVRKETTSMECSRRKEWSIWGIRAIFWRGARSILPEKYGAVPEKWTPEVTWLNRTRQESLTTSIVENRWRTYIYIYIVLLSSIFLKHALNSHFVKYILSVYNNVTSTIGGSEIYIILHKSLSSENGTEWTVRFTGFFSIGLRCQPIGINSHKLFTLDFEIENERMNKNEISLNQKK